MSAVVQSVLIAIVGLIVAVIVGAQLGGGSWIVPIVIVALGLLFAIYKIFLKAIRIEALILGFLIFGYIVGNRGFAQLTLTSASPVYLGETGMLCCIGILLTRLALKREQLIPKSHLSMAIVVFLAIGAVRLCCDVFLHLSPATTVVTLRDSAVVYYALFFFIAYKIGSDAVGRQLLERCVLLACIALFPVFVIQFFAAPEFFNRITVRGYPLIAQKGDLTTTYLAFASFYFFLQPAKGAKLFLFRTLSIFFFVGMLMLMARAALFGYACAVGLLLWARKPQFVLYQVAIGLVALILIASLQIGHIKGESNVVTRLTDRVQSMMDVTGSGKYRGTVGDYSANNNEFRTVWWTTVLNETINKNPIFGLGFGYDLSASFVTNYYSNYYSNWDTRSPHSVWVTLFGRLGIVGWLSFLLIAILIVRSSLRTASLVARGKLPASALAFWTGVIIILGSASFGVVLEGPMGGVLFWSLLGLAASQKEHSSAIEKGSARHQISRKAATRLVPA
jgi:O-Antigen ligase